MESEDPGSGTTCIAGSTTECVAKREPSRCGFSFTLGIAIVSSRTGVTGRESGHIADT